jgi:hypothetical protein
LAQGSNDDRVVVVVLVVIVIVEKEMRSPKSPPPVLADYPNPPSTDPLSLDPHQQLLLVARHSPCLADNCTCHGWKPRSSKSTTDCSRCGHDLQHHGMQEVDGLDEEEKERRIKVASRIDELLNVSDP